MAPRSYPRYHGEGSAGRLLANSAWRNHLFGVLRKAYRLGATAARTRPRRTRVQPRHPESHRRLGAGHRLVSTVRVGKGPR